MLAIRDLQVAFPTEAGLARAVRGVDLDLPEGGALGVVGESGCGKSVTMLAALGLLPSTAEVSGSVRFRGTELLGAGGRQLRRLRGARIGMVFQDPVAALNPVLTVGAQVVEALRVHDRKLSRGQARERAIELMEAVGISEAAQRSRQYPHQFSGGMCQRVMIAVAMANDPDILIADEPTTALDVTIQAQILELLGRIRRDRGVALMLISHDLGVVAGMAEEVAVMYAGKVVERGPVAEVYHRPRHPYTRGLLGALPRLSGGTGRLVPIEGRLPSLLEPFEGCAFAPRCPAVVERCRRDQPRLQAETGPGLVACLRAAELEESVPGEGT